MTASNEANAFNPYFVKYLNKKAPSFPPFKPWERFGWHLFAGMTVFFGAVYLQWRWTHSLNHEHLAFSILVAGAETATFVGTCLFFFDIWDEEDTSISVSAATRTKTTDTFPTKEIDVFITTFDEPESILGYTISAAKRLAIPTGMKTNVFILDDGNRIQIRKLAEATGIGYFGRSDNRGFKAGNIANALYQTRGDLVVVCDADTMLFPEFLVNTTGYFADPEVAWVQTPHWFFEIPPSQGLTRQLYNIGLRAPRFVTRHLTRLGLDKKIGGDPFLSDPSLFFDVIQRRRNRHGASFCCGAASIHRRTALFDNCLKQLASTTTNHSPLSALEQQPFKHHVSEDIFTSIELHKNGWRSIFHPSVEAKMLSPWSVEAWAAQRLKYAGGTYDIMFRTNLFAKSDMKLTHRLHYFATFYAYAGVIWHSILLVAPTFSLTTGISPIEANIFTFFTYFLPPLICNELALLFGTKGHDTFGGRALTIGTIPLQIYAFLKAIRGQTPKFKPTPKLPGTQVNTRYAIPNIVLATVLLLCAGWGIYATLSGTGTLSLSALIINLFWISCNLLFLLRIAFACLCVPTAMENEPTKGITKCS